MNTLEFQFEYDPWETVLASLKPGDGLSAARFLALHANGENDALEQAFMDLDSRDISLDVSTLPLLHGEGEAAVRLRMEQQLVADGFAWQTLEENDTLRLYLEELAAIPAFGDEDLLAQELLAGDPNAPAQLTNLMLSLVLQRATELTGRGVLLLDLIQEGSMGLMEAIASYSGGDIRAFCDRRIRFAMAKAVTLQARASGVGQKLRQAAEDYRAVDQKLLSELGRNPTVEEIADALHMSVEETLTVADMLNAVGTMDKVHGSQPEDAPQEQEQAVEDTAYFQMVQRISELLSRLDESEAKLLTLRFGLEGGKPLSPEETGRKLGLTPTQVVDMEATALAKLRNS